MDKHFEIPTSHDMVHGHNDLTDTQTQGHTSRSTDKLSHVHIWGHTIHKLSGTHNTHILNTQALGDLQKEMDIPVYSVLQTSHVLTNGQTHSNTQGRHFPTCTEHTHMQHSHHQLQRKTHRQQVPTELEGWRHLISGAHLGTH